MIQSEGYGKTQAGLAALEEVKGIYLTSDVYDDLYLTTFGIMCKYLLESESPNKAAAKIMNLNLCKIFI